jgi:hypothetical protein
VTEAEVKSEKTRTFFVALVGEICAETVSSRESARDGNLVHVEDCRYGQQTTVNLERDTPVHAPA